MTEGTRCAVRRLNHRLLPDPRRVLAKPYLPGEEIAPLAASSRAAQLMERILAIPDAETAGLVAGVLADFSSRHLEFEQILLRHFELVAHHLPPSTGSLSVERRLLIGAYFTHEYSVEAAALFNPSIVLSPDQSGLRPEQHRFVMSVRAVGEGHISSIEFRSGRLEGGDVTIDPVGGKLVSGQRTAPLRYDRGRFWTKLRELGVDNDIARSVLAGLPERFTREELEQALAVLQESQLPQVIQFETAKMIRLLAASNYLTTFPAGSELSERVIFPAGPHETRGMEDARFVRFVDDDGAVKFYATYTAFDGYEILPQLIETEDFRSFAISTLNGAAAQNKGMALFPRRIGGKYVMLSRKDRENLHLSTSDDVHHWDDVTELHRPSRPWELLQIGNCGSPLETAAGWLVLTHGVGPMRRYAIGAVLLDLDDPRRVIGQLPGPLLVPDESEREGYVPNVLYSCGGLIDGDDLVLPYGFSDHGIRIAVLSVTDILAHLVAS